MATSRNVMPAPLTRRLAVWAAAVLLAGWPALAPAKGAPLRAAEALTPELRRQLVGSAHLWGPPLEAADLGERVVVVTFFASWCPPCRVELAALKKVHAELAPRGLTVVAVNVFETFEDYSNPRRLAAFLQRMALPFSVVEGSPATRAAFGPVRRIPTLLVYDRQGRLAMRFFNTGPQAASLDGDALRQALRKLL